MTKTILALVAAGILGAAMVPTGAQAFDTTATQPRTEIKQDKTTLHPEHRVVRHDVRTDNPIAPSKLRKSISMPRHDLHRGRELHQDSLK